MLSIAILASGSGTNAQAIIDKIEAGILDARIALLICDKPGAAVIERARRHGLPCEVMERKSFANRETFDRAMLDRLDPAGCELIVLAGYMRLLSPLFLEAYPGRVINIHPALLPSFPGVHGIRDAYDYGVKLAGPSAHFVEEKMDSGPLIIQAAVTCDLSQGIERLEAKIHAAEHRIYPQAIQWIAEGRLERDGRAVYLKDAGKKKAPPPEGTLVFPPLEEGF
ncbi:MAG: phosphoribosylglycinamide formyltransferase [Desulfovibrio sp.]|nr:phosphoribosylglycinamide formyltransferase [Desulfovibrio sp.]